MKLLITMHSSMQFAFMGRRSESSPIIANVLNEYRKSGPLLTSDREVRIAAIYTFLGQKQEAYEWLRKSSWTNSALYEIRQDLWFANINKEKEFQEIVDSVRQQRKIAREEITRLKASGEWNWPKKHLN